MIETLRQSARYQAVSTGLLRSARGLWIGLTIVASFVGLFVVLWGLGLPMFREVALLGVPVFGLAFISARLARSMAGPGPRPASERISAG